MASALEKGWLVSVFFGILGYGSVGCVPFLSHLCLRSPPEAGFGACIGDPEGGGHVRSGYRVVSFEVPRCYDDGEDVLRICVWESLPCF